MAASLSISGIDSGARLPARTRWLWRHAELILGVLLLSLFVLPLLAPHLLTDVNPTKTDVTNALQPPGPEHLLGTDNLGRDVWTRLVYGAQLSLSMGFGAAAISVGAGVVLGLIAGLGGRWVDAIAGRVIDVLFAFPSLLLAMLTIAVLGASQEGAIIAIGVGGIPSFARLVRAEVLRTKESSFVESAQLLGVTRARVILRHVVPNALGVILVLATIEIGVAILSVSALSFLGLGPADEIPELGRMLADAKLYLRAAPWVAVTPGIAVVLAVLGFGLLGRGIQKINRAGVER